MLAWLPGVFHVGNFCRLSRVLFGKSRRVNGLFTIIRKASREARTPSTHKLIRSLTNKDQPSQDGREGSGTG